MIAAYLGLKTPTVNRWRFALPVILLLLSACTANNRTAASIAQQLNRTMAAETAVEKIAKIDYNDRDTAQHYLNLGYLQLVTGDFDSAISSLTRAKVTMRNLQAMSVSENLSAVTVNETLRAYTGWPTDRVMTHGLLAIAYIMKSDVDGARVEMLQADTLMQQLAESNNELGQLAFIRYLAGLVYELNGETDNALISYRKSYEIVEQRSQFVPHALQVALLRMSQQVGLKNEYDQYRAAFDVEAVNQSEMQGVAHHVIYFDGVVSQLKETRTMVWYDIDGTYLNVALPRFGRDNYSPRNATVETQSNLLRTEMIEDLERRARNDFDDELPRITATAVARAATKYAAVKSAHDQDPMLGAFANILTLASEVADLRQWNTMPSSAQVARYIPNLPLYSVATPRANVEITNDNPSHTVIFLTSISSSAHFVQLNQ
ncbi:hypothetical protein [Thalassotalea agarivorans]|uniref:Tetratricopeptide repeat-containing protein n=1 Tax=Thalassotalea agarivorans TaxID=349064 RepID=A0A1H9Y607_THASX|nr:hypothetical protein [Thalassotalea agarivorans]SES64142.1 hypothetical protein SAMN05660429_00085 [Thalassotalea agarivorans]